MTHVFYSKFYDSDGNEITGKISNQNINVFTKNYNQNASTGKNNKHLFYSDTLEFPTLEVTNTTRSVFGKTNKEFEWLYYSAYNNYTIDGITPRTSGGKRIYMAPQGLVVDGETNDYYISFNLGSVYVETANGGPNRVELAGIKNEYANVVPIIKFNNVGIPQGIEYVIGGNHEGYMTIFRGQDGNKRLGVAAYPYGIGTRTSDPKPNGFNNDWTPYYYINDDEQLTYYSFPIDNKFTENNRNSNQLLHSDEYGGNGLVMTKHFSASDFGIQHNPEFHIDPFRKIVQVDTPNREIVESPNIFRVNLARENNSFQVVNYLNSVNIGQGSTNTYQSSCLRGGHLYGSFGGQNNVNQAELRVSSIIGNSQNLINTIVFDDNTINDFSETEGCWVNEDETYIYFMVKSYYPDNVQKNKISFYKTELNW